MFEAAILAQKYFLKQANGRKSITVLVSVQHKMVIEYTKVVPKAQPNESYLFKVSEGQANDPIVEVPA